MLTKKIYVLLMLGITASIFFTSCKDDEDTPEQPQEETPLNKMPTDDTPEVVDIDNALFQLQNDTNGEEDSLAFFIEQAQQDGSSFSGKFYTCRYSYLSRTADGHPIWLTGRMAWPQEGDAEYILAGCHITITDNASVPSQTTNWKSDSGITCLTHASKGLIVFPDYEGYGNTRDRAHPYLYQEATARQVIDGIIAAKEQYEQVRGGHLKDNWKTVVVGYSQGGSVAMATHKYLEQGFNGEQPLANELRLAGSVCGDGPYDPVATLKQYISSDRLYMPVVAPLIMKGMCDANPYLAGNYTIGDFLCADFLNCGIADWISQKYIGTDEIQERLCQYSINHSKWNTGTYPTTPDEPTFVMYGFAQERSYLVFLTDKGFMPMTAENDDNYTWRNKRGDRYAMTTTVMKPAVISYFNGTTPGSPSLIALNQALEMNNLTKGWQPQHPMIVFHSVYDEVVPFVNYEQARASFTSTNFHGVAYDTNVQTHVSVGQSFFTLYLPGYVDKILDGSAAQMPRETNATGLW